MAKKYFKARIEVEESANVETLTSSSSSSIPDLNLVSEESNLRQCPLNPVASSSSAVSMNCPRPSMSSVSFDSIPLDLRLSKKNENGQVTYDPTGSKINVLFSDVDPISTQLYLRAMKETQRSARLSFLQPVEPGPNPENQPVNVREQRRIRKNVKGQLERDEEKYQQYWMLVQVRQMEKRSLALNANLERLEAEKNTLMADILRFLENIGAGGRNLFPGVEEG